MPILHVPLRTYVRTYLQLTPDICYYFEVIVPATLNHRKTSTGIERHLGSILKTSTGIDHIRKASTGVERHLGSILRSHAGEVSHSVSKA